MENKGGYLLYFDDHLKETVKFLKSYLEIRKIAGEGIRTFPLNTNILTKIEKIKDGNKHMAGFIFIGLGENLANLNAPDLTQGNSNQPVGSYASTYLVFKAVGLPQNELNIAESLLPLAMEMVGKPVSLSEVVQLLQATKNNSVVLTDLQELSALLLPLEGKTLTTWQKFALGIQAASLLAAMVAPQA